MMEFDESVFLKTKYNLLVPFTEISEIVPKDCDYIKFAGKWHNQNQVCYVRTSDISKNTDLRLLIALEQVGIDLFK